MGDKGWRNVSIVLAIVCVALLGISAALLYSNPGSSASPLASDVPTQYAVGSPSPTPATTPTKAGTASPSASPSPTVKVTPTPKPTPNAPIASVTFSNMQVDAKADPAGKPRTFVFVSDGPGPVTGKVTLKSPQGSVTLCAQVDQEKPNCWTGANPGFTGMADQAHDTWTVTVIGTDVLTPTINLAFTWPTNSADIRLTHGRLQGLGNDSPLNGVTATFKSRADGQIQVLGTWTQVLIDAVVTCADVTNTPAVNGGEKHYTGGSGFSSLNPPASFAAAANHAYTVQLRDLSADAQRPDLSFELRFP